MQSIPTGDPPWRPADDHALIALVPNIEGTPEWLEAVRDPHFPAWRQMPDDVARVQGKIAIRLIRRLRAEPVRDLVASADPFWLTLALNVVRSRLRWHQSDRIRLSAMSSLRRCLSSASLPPRSKQEIRSILQESLLYLVERGVGQEFKALANLAKAVATPTLVSALARFANTANQRHVRVNAQRMLDRMSGKPYRHYHDCI